MRGGRVGSKGGGDACGHPLGLDSVEALHRRLRLPAGEELEGAVGLSSPRVEAISAAMGAASWGRVRTSRGVPPRFSEGQGWELPIGLTA